MGGFITPAYVKPYTKIATWLLPMCYIEEENLEYIQDNAIVKLVLRKETQRFGKYVKMTLKADALGEPMQYKINIQDRLDPAPIEALIEKACGNEKFMEFEGEFDLLSTTGVKLIQHIFNNLSEDVRSTIAVPLQWLVYKPNEGLLTRLCFVNALKGKVIVKPYTQRSLLLEIHGNVILDRVENIDIRVIKKNVATKQVLNDEWRQMVMESAVSEAIESIVIPKTQKEERVKEKKEESGKVGEVE